MCSQAGLPASSATKEFRDAFTAKYGETKLYAPFFYDATNVVIDSMIRADSTEPPRFAPEIASHGAARRHRASSPSTPRATAATRR